MKYKCIDCDREYEPKINLFRCECGGLFDLSEQPAVFDPEKIDVNEWSQLRYKHTIPINDKLLKAVSMGEGMTPLVSLNIDNPNVLVKVDYMMPTLSFKDRGGAVVAAWALWLGAKNVVQDSSGNAGNSIAAYCGRAGMNCDIYVPEGTSPKKIKMIEAHGAKVIITKGSREDTADAALVHAMRSDVYYASHVYSPFFVQGTKTYVYEIFEQMKGKLPEVLYIPVGNGTLLLGCAIALTDLLSTGLIDKPPLIIAVQSEFCTPLYNEFKGINEPLITAPTKAEGIAVARPMRKVQIIDAIKMLNGIIITAPEDGIDAAQSDLAHSGYYVEPTTAATYAAYKKHTAENPDMADKSTLIPLCGAGLKKG